MLKWKRNIVLNTERMRVTEFKVLVVTALIILISIAIVFSVYEVNIPSSGTINYTTGPVPSSLSGSSQLRYTYFGSESMLLPDWPLVAATIKNYNMGPVVQKALYNMYAPFPLGPINNNNFGVDKLREALNALHPLGIKYHISMAIMLGTKDPSHAMINADGVATGWSDPTNPAFRDHTKAIVEALVQKYEIDGFSFDYVRYDSMDVPYGSYAKASFEQYLGETILDADFRTGGKFAPGGSRYNEFLQWRPIPISNLVRDMRTWMDNARRQYHPELPPLEFSATVFAGYAVTYSNLYYYGQDSIKWVIEGSVDILMPMLYANYNTRNIPDAQEFIDLTGGPEGVIPVAPLHTHVNHGTEKTPVQLADEISQAVALGTDGWSTWAYGGPGDNSGWPDISPYWEAIKSLIGFPSVFSLSNLTRSATGGNATIAWKTDLPATSKVEYNTSPLFTWAQRLSPYTGTPIYYWDIDHVQGTVVEDPTPATGHSITLTGLLPGTLYYFRVQSQDPSGTATSKVYTFQL